MTLAASVDISPPATDLVAALAATVARARGSLLYRDRLAGVQIRALEDLGRLPLTTRGDLQRVGIHGTRAVPLEQVCHYGESSGTTGASNSVWLTAADFAVDARMLMTRHPELFAAGRVILNRFPFMAAPAHLIQLIAQEGGGIAVPAGNINWDVPFPRALELIQQTGVHTLASMPFEPIVLAEIARQRGVDPARDLSVDGMLLGGSPLPPTLRRRLARVWGARVVELYGSTETMLLGTSCAEGVLHLEPALAYCEVVDPADTRATSPAETGHLVVTTLAISGSPLVRLDTEDVVRRLPSCACGDARPAIVVLGRARDAIEVDGRLLYPQELLEAAAAAAEVLDSAVFFAVILADRVVVRIEGHGGLGDPRRAFEAAAPGVRVEIEVVEPGMLLDLDVLARSPRVYKPVVLSDWRRPGRHILTVMEGMIEWPRPGWAEIRRWIRRAWSTASRRRQLVRAVPPEPVR